MGNQQKHIVALRYTAKAGGYAGVITWTDFRSKAAFDTWFSSQDEQEIVEEGITEERAVALTRTTPTKARLMAAVEESCDPDGDVFPELLLEKIRQVLLLESMNKAA